jgi:hypothetical protein
VNDWAWQPEPGITYRVWNDPPWGWVARMTCLKWRSVPVSIALLGMSATADEAKQKCESDWKNRSLSPDKESNDATAFQ